MTGMGSHAKLGKLTALASDNPALLGVAGIGFAVSFQTIAQLARQHGLPGWPPLYPVGIDVGILALITESRKAIDAHRSDLVPRLLAWCLAALTIYVNAHGAAPHDWLGRALHVVMPALWVAFLELTRWRKLARTRDLSDRIPRARWLLSPCRTLGMRRRMILHNVTSYPVAVAREEVRLAAISLMPTVWGGAWRKSAPALLRHHIGSGTLPGDIATACAGYAPAAGELAETWVTNAKASTARTVARVRQQQRAIEADTAAPVITPPATPARTPRKPAIQADKTRDKVARLLADNPTWTLADVAAKAGVSERTVSRIKNAPASRPDLRVAGAS